MLGFVATEVDEKDRDSLCTVSRDVITEIQTIEGAKAFQDRLRSVGIVAGSHIKVLRTGCPIVVHSEGGRFCLRKEDALRIRVAPVPAEVAA